MQSKSSPHKCRAFTFMEVLLALLVFGLVMGTLQVITRHYQHMEALNARNLSTDWQVFLTLVEEELAPSEILGIHQRRIHYRRPDGEVFSLGLHRGRIVIQPGYRPLLFQVQTWQVVREGPILYMEVTLRNGETLYGEIVF